MMKRPLVYALIFLIAGVLTEYYSLRPFAALAAAVVIGLYGYYRWRPVFILLIFYAAGMAAVVFRTGVDPALAGKEIVIRGVVTDEARTGSGYRLTVSCDGIKIAVSTMNERPVGTGGKVEFRAMLEALSRKRNPGGFDEFLYMRARGIHYKAFYRHLTPVAVPSLRSKISAVYDEVLPVGDAGIVRAMILGDKSGLGERITELYRVAGVYHILAISGLHISVLAMFIDFLLSRFLGRRRSGAVTIVFLIFYCIFTGCGVSVVRASIMYGVLISGNILYRENDSLSSVAFAAILLLLWQPLYLWDVGFLYSFSAVIGIITLTRPIKSALSRINAPDAVVEALAATTAATLCTTPVSAYFFYYVMPYGIIANLIIVPTAGFVVVLGFITGAVGLFIKPAALFLAGGLHTMFSLYERVCEVFASLPGAAILTGSWPPLFVAGWYLLIAAAILGGARALSLGVAAYAALVFVSVNIPVPPEAFALEVEKGGCTVFIHKGEAYVFDGGGDNAYTLENYLNYRGIGTVDGYFGMHKNYHNADAMLDRLKVRAIFARKELGGLNYYARDGKIYFDEIAPGRTLVKDGLEFRISEGYAVTVKIEGEEFEIR